MITLENVTKTYTTKGGEVEALRGISLELPQSGLYCVVGKSGCGKSTLLNLLGGLDTPTSGAVLLDGKPTDTDASRKKVSYVFQDFGLFPFLTAEENIRVTGCSHEEAQRLLGQVGLEGFGKRSMRTLSGGEQQRLAIARALSRHCAVILADEPTGNLDEDNAEDVFRTFVEIAKTRLVVVVTHDNEAAEQYADTILYLSDGQITEVKELRAKASAQTEIRAVESAPDVNKSRFGQNLKFAVALLRRGTGRSVVFCLLLTLFFSFLFLLQMFLSANTLNLTFRLIRENDYKYITVGQGDKNDGSTYLEFNRDTLQYLKERSNFVLGDLGVSFQTRQSDFGIIFGELPDLKILEGTNEGGVLIARSASNAANSNNPAVGDTFRIFEKTVRIVGIFDDRVAGFSEPMPKHLIAERDMPELSRSYTARGAMIAIEEGYENLIRDLINEYGCYFRFLGTAEMKDGTTVDTTSFVLYRGSIADNFWGIGLAVTAVLGVLSVLYVVYFTAFFITESKRDIAILRAFGASGGEVRLIFLLQCCFLLLVSLVAAIVATAITAWQLNAAAWISYLRVNGYSALVAIGMIAVCLASVLLPLRRLKRMSLNPMMKKA